MKKDVPTSVVPDKGAAIIAANKLRDQFREGGDA